MSRTVTLRLDDEVYRELKEAAEAARCPLSSLIGRAALLKVREEQLLDDAEMAEILANESLLERMRKGSRQALEGKGTLAE